MKRIAKKIIVLSIVLVLSAISVMGYLHSNVLASNTKTNQSVEELLNLKQSLRFNEDGKFKILIFSDVQERYPINEDTIRYMNTYLDQEKPDLVLFTGDNHSGDAKAPNTKEKMIQYLTQLAEPMESRNIPWAQVYGNHAEGGYKYEMGLSKQEQQEIFESFSHNVSKAGNVYGVGNYVLPILRSDSDKVGFNVFMMDTHSYLYKYQEDLEKEVLLQTEVDGTTVNGSTIYSGNTYDVVHFDQIKWYWDTSVALEKYNGSLIPAMMLFHIPVYEWNYIVKNPETTGMIGQQGDVLGTPEANSGLFQACYERGDVKTLIGGHDHVNDFSGEYMGITMAYAATIGSYAYHDETRGVRIVEIDQDDAFNIATYMKYTDDLK